METLTKRQLKALNWIATKHHQRAGWTVNRKAVMREHPDAWTHLRLSGDEGSIFIHKDDMRAIGPFIRSVATRDKLWDVTKAGRAILSAQEPTP